MIYLVVFSLSCLLLWISNKITDKFTKKIVEIIALLLPCILGGLRHISIGTDVQVYVEPLFNLAKNSSDFLGFYKMSWWDSWRYRYVTDFELFFNILVFMITKITNNIQWVLFSIQSFIIFPIYFGIKKIPQIKNKSWLVMLIFYLTFYNISYNAMRQFISIAIIFWGTCCLIGEKNGKLKFFLSLVFSFFFHKSALLGIIIYIIYKLLKKDFKHNKTIVIGSHKLSIQKLALIMIIFILVIFVFNSSLLTNILSFLGLNYYNVYITGNIVFNFNKINKYLPIILILFVVRKEYFKEENAHFYLLMFISDILISYFSSVNIYAARIGFIFQIFNIIFFTKIIQAAKNKTNQRIISFIIIFYSLFFWYYNFVIIGANETIPYVFFMK